MLGFGASNIRALTVYTYIWKSFPTHFTLHFVCSSDAVCLRIINVDCFEYFSDIRFESLFRTKMTRSSDRFKQTYSLISEFPGTLGTAWTRSTIECGMLCKEMSNCSHFRYDDAAGDSNCMFLSMWKHVHCDRHLVDLVVTCYQCRRMI